MKKQMTENLKTNKGITLIALVITIVVMLILVAVTISIAVNGGLFDYAGKAVGDTQNAMDAEQQLANGRIKIGETWYDSIDDYMKKIPSANQGEGEGDTGGTEEPEGPVQIQLSISGEKSTTVPALTGFTHTEGTIDEGYVITDEVDENGKSIGNEFVWVPVEKNQKLTLKVESEKEIEELKLYDPYGEEVNLGITAGNIGTTYNNTSINPTVNGMYMAVVKTEDDEIIQETLTVRSLYARDAWNDWYTSDEYAKTQGDFNTIEEYVKDLYKLDSIETALEAMGYLTLEVALSANNASAVKENDCQDLVDYSQNVNDNGGFFIGRYEAGATNPRVISKSTATVEEIIGAHGVPVSKEDYYPYCSITFSQALGLAESMYNSTEFIDSLMTSTAWDRTLWWIYETSENKDDILNKLFVDSTSWGNYKPVSFTITKGSYRVDSENTFDTGWRKVSDEELGKYTKPADEGILLTTGATTRNRKNNIFDLAGNIDEVMNSSKSSGFIILRGGDYFDNIQRRKVFVSGSGEQDSSSLNCGFRTALYLQ